MHQRPARTKLDHINRALPTRNQMSAREEDDLSRAAQAEQTLRRRVSIVRVRHRGGRRRALLGWRVGVVRRRRRRRGSEWMGRSRAVRRETVDLVQVERVWADTRFALDDFDDPRSVVLRFGLRGRFALLWLWRRRLLLLTRLTI